MSNATQSWWAGTTTRARWTAVAAGAIALTLIAISAVVWSSPSSPVQQAIGAAIDEPTREDELIEERGKLLDQVVALKHQLNQSESGLASLSTERDTLQQSLWSAEGQLEAIAAAKASGAGNSGSSRGSGSAKSVAPAKQASATVNREEPRATPVAEPITAPAIDQLLNPSSKYFGMYTEQAPFNWATFDDTASRIGVNPGFVGYFGGWDENFRANAVQRSWETDRLPVLTWESRPIAAKNDEVNAPEYSLPRILDGAFDEYLHQYARDVVATGLPLGIRLNHEMNGVWYPWSEMDSKGNPINGNRPGDYAKVWKHVHDIFEAEGANDLVIWIWAPNRVDNVPASHKTPEYLASLYPGDEYVDWIGLSGYLRPAYKSDFKPTFDYTFGASLAAVRQVADKPILLAEVGASEVGGYKPKWITSFFESLARPENDDIIGFGWFNLAVTTYVEGERLTNDWRVTSRPDSLEAFIAGITAEGSGYATH
ncbi:glycoside hydrolase family 26 protein [Salinibacterium sp. ZJ450]|uniref:glycoside hydrolase family 26 protein n=1 Tax=Salinibacterium sp. ZJ450 TaxID=2708338 RepID=UPI00141FF918|nr:glycosyl hydrolase [Salinibacterium sp. ZJ450]